MGEISTWYSNKSSTTEKFLEIIERSSWKYIVKNYFCILRKGHKSLRIVVFNIQI